MTSTRSRFGHGAIDSVGSGAPGLPRNEIRNIECIRGIDLPRDTGGTRFDEIVPCRVYPTWLEGGQHLRRCLRVVVETDGAWGVSGGVTGGDGDREFCWRDA